MTPIQLRAVGKSVDSVTESLDVKASLEVDVMQHTLGCRVLEFLSNFWDRDNELKVFAQSFFGFLCNLRHLMLRGRMKASDARDLVYGILGVAKIDEPFVVSPDYSLSVRAVFISATRSVIANRRDLHVLDICDGAGDTSPKTLLGPDDRLPSWVPDYTCSLYYLVHRPHMDLAESNGNHNATQMTRIDQLHVRGRQVETVMRRLSGLFRLVRNCYVTVWFGPSCYLPHYVLLEHYLTDLKLSHGRTLSLGMLWRMCMRSKVCQFPRRLGFVDDLLNETLCKSNECLLQRNKSSLQQNAQESRELEESLAECESKLELELNGAVMCVHGVYWPPFVCVEEDCSSHQHREHLWFYHDLEDEPFDEIFFTTDNRVLLTYNKVLEGDVICILHGCTFPVVLRKQQPGQYLYITGCDIEDVERGNAVTWSEDDADDFLLI